MRWRGRRGSSNIEDRRGRGGFRFPRRMGSPGGFRFPRGSRRGRVARGSGIGGIGLLILLGIMFFAGIDPRVLFQGGGADPTVLSGAQQPRTAAEEEAAQFVSVVLADTEDIWNGLFARELDADYQEPTLVLFSNAVRSACGLAQAATGPFYCPSDRKVYIDLSFFDELKRRFQAPGDFAQAYVIAHEVGHHVQTLLGISQQVHEARGRVGQTEYNQLSVRLELQADCLAGVWANHADARFQILEEGDIDEALNAASAIGDDRIQRQTQGTVQPDSFTHGSSAQRVRWFKRGLSEGNIGTCDTFEARAL